MPMDADAIANLREDIETVREGMERLQSWIVQLEAMNGLPAEDREAGQQMLIRPMRKVLRSARHILREVEQDLPRPRYGLQKGVSSSTADG